jgi:hypothetical protein
MAASIFCSSVCFLAAASLISFWSFSSREAYDLPSWLSEDTRDMSITAMRAGLGVASCATATPVPARARARTAGNVFFMGSP